MQLVAGSGATETQDEQANAPVAPGTPGDSGSAAPATDDGYQAGIPGPITRLFVIANRGIANLIQDLILVSAYLLFSNVGHMWEVAYWGLSREE